MKKVLVIAMAILLLFGNTQCVFADEEDCVVIVLDPGHDIRHAGASGNGISETASNLKIAQYCYEELSTYSNVKVYMTRYTSACAFPETFTMSESSQTCNNKRVAFAASVGADAVVSLHLNSNTNKSANGASIYIPNQVYRPEIGTKGRALGGCILKQLTALGLKDMGLVTKASTDDTFYPDGSLGDYYRIVRESKKANIPGVIVEHAFVSNASDAANFLNSDAKLKALGVADAKGIAEYFGLTKGGNVLTPDTLYKVEFKRNGALVCTQYVRNGHNAQELLPEEYGVTSISYTESLENVTADRVINVTYGPALEKDPEPTPRPTPTPTPTPTPDTSETETESETTSEVETEEKSDTQMETENTQQSTEVSGDAEGNPKNDNGFVWFILGGVAFAAIGGGIYYYKFRKKEEE